MAMDYFLFWSRFWNGTGPCGALLGTNPFCVSGFLFVGSRLHSASLTFGQIQTVANQGREGMQKQGRSSQETIVQPWGIYITISLSSSAGTKARTLVEDGNFKLSTSPPTNQKKAAHPASLTPNFAYKDVYRQNHQGFQGFRAQATHPPCIGAFTVNAAFSFTIAQCQ